jgi:hypothetical protein
VWDFIFCVIAGLNNVCLYEYLCKNLFKILCEFCGKFGLTSELHASAERGCTQRACMQAQRGKANAVGGEEKNEREKRHY